MSRLKSKPTIPEDSTSLDHVAPSSQITMFCVAPSILGWLYEGLLDNNTNLVKMFKFFYAIHVSRFCFHLRLVHADEFFV
jgi:hypothetical protein